VSAEAEKSPLLETVTRERLVNDCVCYSVEISDGAIIECSHELCVEVDNKSNLHYKTPSRDNTVEAEGRNIHILFSQIVCS
jgi:hypothetical protein